MENSQTAAEKLVKELQEMRFQQELDYKYDHALKVNFPAIADAFLALQRQVEEQGRSKDAAIDLAVQYGGIDGDHHKAWVIDQMVRELTECPKVKASAIDCNGLPYSFDELGESEEYKRVVREAKAGEDGPDSYDWNTGIAP
jgi:hypothetical protein